MDPPMLLLEFVELLSGLGVAIVVLGSSSSARAAVQSETSPERSICTAATSVPVLRSCAVGNATPRLFVCVSPVLFLSIHGVLGPLREKREFSNISREKKPKCYEIEAVTF